MKDLFKLIFGALASLFKSRAKLEAEILVLRQQINVLGRRAPKRPPMNNTDRFMFVWLAEAHTLRRYSDASERQRLELLGEL
jgi:hypothetical protein